MKKLLYNLRILFIAIWPVAFLLIFGYMGIEFRAAAERAFNFSPYVGVLIGYCFVAGLLFAVIGICDGEMEKRKAVYYAHIAAGVTAVPLTILRVLGITGSVSYPPGIKGILYEIFQQNLYLVASVLGYTIYTAIRAIFLLHNRRHVEMINFEAGVKSIIQHNRKVLLLQRPNDSWEFPGGHVEYGEDLPSALRREISEETGLDELHIDRLLYTVSFPINPERQTVGMMYLSHVENEKVTISAEHKDSKWVNKEELLNLLYQCMIDELTENSILGSLEID